MVNITLKQCRYFSAVAHSGGVAQAARSLNISQPAISQALEKLEITYGFKLFIRHHAKGMELTVQGRDFLTYVDKLLQDAMQLESRAQSIATNVTGTLHFGCFHTISPFHMPRIIKGYSEKFPQIEVKPSELQQETLIKKIINGKLDLALTYDMELNSTFLSWQVVSRLKPFVILPEGHRFANAEAVRLKDLADDPYIMFDGFSSKSYFERILSNAGVEPKIAYSAFSMESVRCNVANGLGYSISIMRPKTNQTYDGHKIIAIPIKEKLPLLSLVIAWRKGAPLQEIVENFKQYCIHEISQTSTR